MTTLTSYCIGIDVDKISFKASLIARLTTGETAVKASKTFNNKQSGFLQLIAWADKYTKQKDCPRSFVMEATGVYHEHLACYLHTNKMCVHVVLANKAKKYMQSLGHRSKNDQIDAQGLAIMGLQQHLEQWNPLSKQYYSLRSITRQIEVLQHSKTQFNNQLEAANHSAFVDPFVIKMLKSVIKKLDNNIQSCRKKIETIIDNDSFLKQKYELFKGLKGFGLMTFAVIVAETGGFELFNSQSQLVCYAGYDIIENQSGNRTGRARMSKKGNSHIRRILFMPAFSVVRYETATFKPLFERVYEKTKVKMKGYVAVQRKLLCLIYALWKKNEPFENDYMKINNFQNQEPKTSFGVVA